MREMTPPVKLTKSRHIAAVLMLLVFSLVLSNLSGCGSKTSVNNLKSEERSTNQVAYDSAAAPSTPQVGSESDPITLDRRTIQKADLNIRVQDVTAAVDQIMALSGENGGYTVNSRVYRENDQVSGRLAIKVPQANLYSVISSISACGEVTDKTIAAQDVTEEYYDSQARLKVLQAKEERLLSLMDKAANITEIISVENELSKTRSEIEVLTGRLQYLTNATEYSLINITLVQGLPGTIQAPQGTAGKSWQGLISSISGMINFASATVVFLFTALPWLVVVLLLYLLGRYGYKRTRTRNPIE